MIFIGPHVFEVYETPQKMLKLRCIHDGEMGPWRSVQDSKRAVMSPAVFSAYREIVLSTLHYVTKKIYNEGYYMKAKTLEILESLAKQYDFKDLIAWFERYWQDWEKVSFANNLPLEAKNRPDVEHETNKLIRQFKEEMETDDSYQELRQARIDYLEEEKANICSHLDSLNADIKGMEDRDCEEWLIKLYKSMNKWDFYDGKARSIGITLAHLKGAYQGKKVLITDDMIKAAKQVPFDKLLKLEQFGRMKRCKCPFHNEKTASFYVYTDTNRGHCHGCGKNVDTIQYLVEIKKIEFNQAVLLLLDY